MFRTFLTILIRQLKQASIRLYFAAITPACAVTFSIGSLGDRMEQLLNDQAKAVLAADLVLESTSSLTEQQNDIVSSFPLIKAKTLSFQSMVNSDSSNKFLLSSLKAVSETFEYMTEM